MTHVADGLKLSDVAKLPGVGDLPMAVRGKFAIALRQEAKGDSVGAEKALNEAVDAEQKA